MAKYIPLLTSDQHHLVMMKTTTASPADGDWDNQDNVILPAGGSPVISMWAYENTTVAFDFDGSDVAASDPGAVWTNETNVDDGDDSTDATCNTAGTSTSNYIEVQGTGASASGETINTVSVMVRAKSSGVFSIFGIRVTTDAAGETLFDSTGDLHSVGSTVEDVFATLAAPSGGWTWAKIQALEIRYWFDSNNTLSIFRGQVIVDIAGEGDIHIATQQQNGRVAYHVFDPGTDAWTIRDEQVAVVGDTNFDAVPAEPAVCLALRSDGDVVLIVAYNDGTDETLRCFTEQGSGWTNEGEASGAAASTDYTGVAVIGPDSSDRISWVYGDITNDDVDLNSLSSVDAFDGATEVDAAVDTATLLVGPSVIDSANKIYVPYIDADDKISVADWTSGASPTVNLVTGISDNDVYGNGRTAVPFIVACLAIDGTNVYLLYANDTDQDLYFDPYAAEGGRLDVEELDTVTVNRISCKMGITRLLYTYDDDGTTKFGQTLRLSETLANLSDGILGVQNTFAGPFEI